MEFFFDTTFGWCFVLGEIVMIFAIFMVLHRRALRRHEELTEKDEASGHNTQATSA